jgi:hypothetical protein
MAAKAGLDIGFGVAAQIGRGREAADAWTPAQEGFGEAITKIHDSFYAASAAGTLTLEQALAKLMLLEQTIADLWRRMTDFSKTGGENQLKHELVVDQMLKGWAPWLTAIREGFWNTILSLGGTPEQIAKFSMTDLTHLHTGDPFVEETGPVMIERGERVMSRDDNQTLIELMQEMVANTRGGRAARPARIVIELDGRELAHVLIPNLNKAVEDDGFILRATHLAPA